MQTDAPTTGLPQDLVEQAHSVWRRFFYPTKEANFWFIRDWPEDVKDDFTGMGLAMGDVIRELLAVHGIDVTRPEPPALETQGAHEGVIEALREAFAPFVDIGAQKGAWGAISKKLDGMAPLTVTVTKAQMLAAITAIRALSSGKTVSAGEGEG